MMSKDSDEKKRAGKEIKGNEIRVNDAEEINRDRGEDTKQVLEKSVDDMFKEFECR